MLYGIAGRRYVLGVMVHPGSAKDVIVNAITVASSSGDGAAFERPEHTEGREGFTTPSASRICLKVKFPTIIRDFDSDIF